MSVYVPPITERERIPQEAIDEVVRQIAEEFQPQKIILFGSYARGDFHPESDLDLLVVMETPLRELEQALSIQLSLSRGFGMDIIVRTPQNLQRRLNMGDWFLKEIIEEGVTVYESPHP